MLKAETHAFILISTHKEGTKREEIEIELVLVPENNEGFHDWNDQKEKKNAGLLVQWQRYQRFRPQLRRASSVEINNGEDDQYAWTDVLKIERSF